MTSRAPVAQLIEELAVRLGRRALVDECVELMAGADRADHVEVLRGLTGHAWRPGDDVLDPDRWHDYWVRTWGARGLLHGWEGTGATATATAAVVAGLDDEHWRPAEMCLKVAARHDVAGTGDGAARLARHDLPRVRVAAVRALAVVGDVEQVEAVGACRDDDDDAVVRRQAELAHARLVERLDEGLND